MLRGRIENRPDPVSGTLTPGTGTSDYPDSEQPFALDERPAGIAFYWPKTSRFHPYALLQSMGWADETITLNFASADVVITGRGLHALYVLLATQRVARIVEQGSRCAATSTAALVIERITEVPK
jgi:hypothetical protein